MPSVRRTPGKTRARKLAFIFVGFFGFFGVVASLAVVTVAVRDWHRKEKCRSTDGMWLGDHCLEKHDSCVLGGDRTVPVGAVFADGCNTCECKPYTIGCTSVGCINNIYARKPSCPCAIFDPGCDQPRSYCGRCGAFSERAYCGCDGATFVAMAPLKPYRHLGPCSASDPSASAAQASSALPAERGRCLTVEATAKYSVVFVATAERVQSIFVGWRKPGPPRTKIERDPLTGTDLALRTTEPDETDAGPAAEEWDLEADDIAPDGGYDGYLESMIPPQIRALPHRPMKRIVFEMMVLAQVLVGNDNESLEALFPPSGCTTSMPLLRLPASAVTALHGLDDQGANRLARRLAQDRGFPGWSAAEIREFLAELRSLLAASGADGLYVLPV
jgi:hypothetical protein